MQHSVMKGMPAAGQQHFARRGARGVILAVKPCCILVLSAPNTHLPPWQERSSFLSRSPCKGDEHTSCCGPGNLGALQIYSTSDSCMLFRT